MTPSEEKHPIHPDRFRFILLIGLIASVSLFLFLLKTGIFQLLDLYLFPYFNSSFSLTDSIVGEIISGTLNILNLFVSSFLGITLLNRIFPKTGSQANNSLSLASSKSELVSPWFTFQGLSVKNFPRQILEGLMLLCMVYIPLDCIGYMFPGILDYSANQFEVFSTDSNNYFKFAFLAMLGITIIRNFLTAMSEEFVFREIYVLSSKKYVNSASAFFYSAIAFSLGHFGYILVLERSYSWLFPVWWGVNALIIGFVSAWYFLKYSRLWPLIIAHLGNNVVSSLALRFYGLERPFWSFTIPRLYGIFIIVGFILYFFKKSVILDFFKQSVEYTRDYFNNLTTGKEKLIDLGLIFLLWFISMLLIAI